MGIVRGSCQYGVWGKLTSCMRPYMMGVETLPPEGLTTRSMALVTDVKASTAARAADLVERNILGDVSTNCQDTNKHKMNGFVCVSLQDEDSTSTR